MKKVFLFAAFFVATSTSVVAQSQVEPTSHHAPVPLPSAESITFATESARVGDRVAQEVALELEISTTIEQAGQIASHSTTKIQKNQLRFIEVLEIADGLVRRAHVSFPRSRITSPETGSADEQVQVVEGKSYLVARRGESLLVTDLDGAIPTQAEFEIVVQSVQTLGLPNPLALYLRHRTLRVGERLELPEHLAREAMGIDRSLGEVHKFEFVLDEIRTLGGRPCAVFAATIRTKGDPETPVEITATGPVVVEGPTCRTLEATLAGPLAMATTEQTGAEAFRYAAEGKMHVTLKSQYGHAPK